MQVFPLKLTQKNMNEKSSPEAQSNRSSKSREPVKLVQLNSLTNSDQSSPEHRQNSSMMSGKILPSATELDVDFDISNTMVSLNML